MLEHPLPSLAIPTTLHDSLIARLDRFAPVREVAQIGAVVGRSFSYELLNAVAGIPREKLEEALGQLVLSELIFRRGEIPHAVYTFKHVLVRDAAYSSLLKSRRANLHAAIASAFEAALSLVTICASNAAFVKDRKESCALLAVMVSTTAVFDTFSN